MPYSRVTYTAAGGPEVFAVNFTLGYLRQAHVTARVNDEVDGGDNPVYRTLTWLTEGTVTLGGAALVAGDKVVLQRNTPKTALIHDYSDGEIMTEKNFDESFLQTIMIAHEALDGRLSTFEQDIDMGNHQIKNLADGTDAQDAATLSQLQAMTGDAPGYAAIAQAAASAAAGSSSTASGFATAAQGYSTDASNYAAAAAASAAGMKWRPTVKCITTVNDSLSGLAARNGYTPIAGDRILVAAQSSAAANGVYTAAAGAWTRATDADTWNELIGMVVVTEQGTVNADVPYICTVNSGGTLGVTAVTFVAFPIPLVDSSVTTTKYADDSLTFAKVNSGALASLADWAAGTASKLLTANNFLGALAAAIGFRKIFVSSPQVITSAGPLTLPHGLPAAPSLVTMQLVCQTAEHGFTVGQVINVQLGVQDSSAARGVSVISDATNLVVRYGSTATAMIYIHATTGNQVLLTNANWRAVFTAWG